MKRSCRISIQERNCYCNGPGVWSMNMLQCGICRRWYHDNCVQCLRSPMLFGDRFFVFVCALCNSNMEFLARLELKWVDVAHLVLYNLSVISSNKHHVNRRYFDFNIEIMPFLCENWSKMNLIGEVSQSNNGERRRKLLEALQGNNKRFKCGKEIKKSRALWALRQPNPPVAPHVVPTKSQKEPGLWEFKIPGRYSEIVSGKKCILETKESTIDQKQCLEKKNNSASTKCQGSTLQNGSKKTSTKSKKTSFNEEIATYNLLNIMIPSLPNYKQVNNPFKRPRSGSKIQEILPPSKHRKISITNEFKSTDFTNGITKSPANGKSVSINNRNGSLPVTDKVNCQSKVSKLNDKNGICLKNVKILGRRMTKDGKVQYLFEWKT